MTEPKLQLSIDHYVESDGEIIKRRGTSLPITLAGLEAIVKLFENDPFLEGFLEDVINEVEFCHRN